MNFLWVLGVLGALGGVLDHASAGTLDDIVRQAIATSPALGEVKSNQLSAQEEVLQAKGQYLPKLDIESYYSPQWADKPNSLSAAANRDWTKARSGGLVLRQAIFDGFARDSELLRQQARLNGATSRVLEQTQLVSLAAVEAHIDVVRQRNVVKAAIENVAAHKSIEVDVEERYKGGGTGIAEVEQIRERVASAEALLSDFQRSLAAAEAKYAKVVGVPPGPLAEARFPRTKLTSRADVVALAVASNPGLVAAGFDVDAARADVDQAKSKFMPQVGVEMRASRGADLSNAQGKANEASARVVMGWSLFNGGIDESRVGQRVEQVNAQRFKLEKLRRDIEEGIASDWAILETGKTRIAALRRQKDTSARVIAAYLSEFDAGRRTLLDVLDAKASDFQARIGLLGASAVDLLARYRILASGARMSAEFKLPDQIGPARSSLSGLLTATPDLAATAGATPLRP